LPAAIICIDLDHFKPVNDRGGHAAGDAMLVAVAAAIASAVRATDLVARPGGDEFTVLLERCNAAAALHTAEHICAAVAAVVLPWEGQRFRASASVGVASLAADTSSFSAWLAQADAACYAAKAAGRGVVRGAVQPVLPSAVETLGGEQTP
jgi:diguanylate cyclase (GGDEF)-like protein